MKRLIFFILICTTAFAQDEFDYSGYVQNLQSLIVLKNNENWKSVNSFSNRINLNYYNGNATVEVGIRNIFEYGYFVENIPGYSDLTTNDNGFMDLTEKIYSGKSYLLYSNVDRLNLKYTWDNIDVTIGRQRINWGVNLVWNPNDIFNSYSFINFDYEERLGSDAVRVQYYSDYSTSYQFAIKADRNKNITSAFMYKTSLWNYDFQMLAGVTKDDYIYGFGYSGEIEGVGFNGEATYFDSKKGENKFLLSIGANYTFTNSLYIHSAYLFNENGSNPQKEKTGIFNLNNADVKNLSLGKNELFTELKYQFTPLLKGNISSIVNLNNKSFFISPSLEYSLSDNIYLLFIPQLFYGENGTEFGSIGKFYHLRLKWNF